MNLDETTGIHVIEIEDTTVIAMRMFVAAAIIAIGETTTGLLAGVTGIELVGGAVRWKRMVDPPIRSPEDVAKVERVDIEAPEVARAPRLVPMPRRGSPLGRSPGCR